MARKSNKNFKPSISVSDINLDALIDEAEAEAKPVELSHYGFTLPLSPMDEMAEKLLGILENKVIPYATLTKIAAQVIPPDAGASVEEIKEKRMEYECSLFAALRRGAVHTERKLTGNHKPEGLVDGHIKMYMPRKRKSDGSGEE